MRCPLCGRANNLGLLTSQKRKTSGVISTFFCHSCCIEFTTQNNRLINIVKIDAEGEAYRLNVGSAGAR